MPNDAPIDMNADSDAKTQDAHQDKDQLMSPPSFWNSSLTQSKLTLGTPAEKTHHLIDHRVIHPDSKDAPESILLPEVFHSKSGDYSFDEFVRILKNETHDILVHGETGSGKEMVALCAALLSGHKELKTINCAGLDGNTVNSELFGHTKGAFTDAKEMKQGILEVTDADIIFLDEIGWLPKAVQAKLLRYMMTGEIRKVGGGTK